MMTNDWKPNVGDLLHVRTEYKYGCRHDILIKSGRVVKSERYDPKNTFRLYTGNPQYPVSIIALERVTGVKLRKGAV